ncbi:hypothetical protein GGR28_003552 [Lewinella aquimaris]|uniref:SusF/SusE family outer membrane protein n=1 Tax=Neolewinella aquimaris TaxID=1835722 RepID=A0A840EAE3_9BACT|nr:SusF/SusE family outer membrane protein [Neolewinella aquimaris]MBB4080913.1 hypothetical protein [Neolewinella aquimaris]
MQTKQLTSWLFLLLMVALTGCEREEIDIAANTDFPPAILSSTPSANGRVVAGDFDVRVVFADGSISPLQSATVTLMDSAMNVLATADQPLSGIQDSVVIEGSTFNAASLGVGVYNMSISVTDTKGQTTTQDFSFEISNLPYPANHDNIFIAGGFNGWGADALTLVSDHIWEIQNVDLQGEAWKLKNCADWCDEDWGDAQCNGFMVSNFADGGNGDTNCGNTGLVNIRFNDQTLSYSVMPAVSYASNSMSLYLLGTFNTFQGGEYQFQLVDDNRWVLDEVLLAPGDQFKMAEMPDFQGINYGDDENDGTAERYGSNIVLPATATEGYYRIDFNDRSLAYELTFLRAAAPESVGILGDATPTGWDSDTDMTDEGNGVYTTTIELIDGTVKFRANDAWDLSWGGTEFPTGTAVVGGGDIPVTAGTYKVTLDITNLTYSFVVDSGIGSIGLVGDATPGGWDNDTPFTKNDDGTWSALIGLGNGNAKFRADGNWDVNWGGSDFPSGTGTQGGADIPVTAGIYLVTLDPVSGEYSFAPATIGLIGDSTPGGWDADTDLTLNPDVMGEVKGEVTLTAGAAKFRANDAWDYDWGGSDFPSGTATFKGGDIPVTAGTYTVKFNVNTLAYSFE